MDEDLAKQASFNSWPKVHWPVLNEGESAVPTLCAMCGPRGGSCGIWAIVKKGRFVRVEGMKDSPVNQGRNCSKAHAAPQWVYSPQRLKDPLLRTGAKGSGKFAKISWDEAVDRIADKLKEQKVQYGPESLAVMSPARRNYSDYIYRFLMAHGSPNYGHSGICATQRSFCYAYTLGTTKPTPEMKNSDLIIIWGKQPVYAGSCKGGTRTLLEAKKRGAKIVVIKPSMEPDAAQADIWLPIRPGTDAALALAWLHIVINENLCDMPFVNQFCHGFDELKNHVQQYTPKWAATITGLDEELIISTVRLYASTERAAIDIGNGLEHAPSASDAMRAIASLIAITGHFDRPGSNVVAAGSTMPTPKTLHLKERYTQQWVDKLVAPEFPRPFQPFREGTSSAYYSIFDSILTEQPYPIRTVIAPGTQPAVSNRGPRRVIEALQKLDFFVVVDVMQTAEMDYADIVLPVATPYEIDHPFEASTNWIMARNKVIEPLGDYKSTNEFWIDLGVKMGYGDDFWNGSIETAINEQLAPLALTYAELQSRPTGISYPKKEMRYEKYAEIFAARSPRIGKAPFLPEGKVALYNTSFAEQGYAPLPQWHEPPESLSGTPGLVPRYPLVFSDYHTSSVYNAAWLRNVPLLREIMPWPTLHIHPETAAKRGIDNDDWVEVESPHGRIRLKAQLFPGVRPDTVMALHGWWQGCDELNLPGFPLLDGGANTNLMYSVAENAFDPLITAMSSQTLVEVRKLENQEAGHEQ